MKRACRTALAPRIPSVPMAGAPILLRRCGGSGISQHSRMTFSAHSQFAQPLQCRRFTSDSAEGKDDSIHHKKLPVSHSRKEIVLAGVTNVLSARKFDREGLKVLETFADWRAAAEMISSEDWKQQHVDDVTKYEQVKTIVAHILAKNLNGDDDAAHPNESIAKFLTGCFEDIHAAMKLKDEPPIDTILEALRENNNTFGYSVFPIDIGTIRQRMTVKDNTIHESKAKIGIMNTSASKTVLLGGASGAGKTATIIGLADKYTDSPIPKTFVVLFRYENFVQMATTEMVTEVKECASLKGEELAAAASYYIADKLDPQNSERDNFVKGVFKKLVKTAMGDKAFDAMQRSSEMPEIDLYVALDEAGANSDLVRAMVSITPEAMGQALEFVPEPDTTGNVTVRLIAAGTGVGNGPRVWGSQNKNFELIFAEGDKHNIKIMNSYNLTPFETKPIEDFVKSNSRVAVLFCDLLRDVSSWLKINKKTTSESPTAELPTSESPTSESPTLKARSLKSFDVLSLLSLVAMKFKGLNGLDSISDLSALTLAILALRMYLFPFADVPLNQVAKMEVDYGLVIDKSMAINVSDLKKPEYATYVPIKARYTKSSGSSNNRPADAAVNLSLLCAPTAGRYEIPYFTMALLASMCKVPWATKSALSGDSLERYWVGVSTLVACAALSADLFELMLRTETLAPLKLHRTARDLKDVTQICGAQQISTKVLVNLDKELADMHKIWKAPVKKTKQMAKTRSKNTQQSYAVLAEETKLWGENGDAYVISISDALQAKASFKTGGKCRIAAFRSPPQAPFADSALFYDNKLFLFQMKDCAKEEGYAWEPMILAEERWKMGACDAKVLEYACGRANREYTHKIKTLKGVMSAPMKPAKEAGRNKKSKDGREFDPSTSERVVKQMRQVWYEVTGMKIERIIRCFVTPQAHKFTKATRNPEDIFITTNGITFLKFDSKRSGDAARLDLDGTLALADAAASAPLVPSSNSK